LLQDGYVNAYDKQKILDDLQGGRLIKPQLVVVSACKSHDCAQMFVKAQVPHVVAINRWHSVLDTACHVFANTFYNCLMNGQTVQSAFERAQIRVKHDVRAAFFRCFPASAR
jgi:hypothetical protein